MASLRRFERLTFTFGGCHSIQLSYRDAYRGQLLAWGFFVNRFDQMRSFPPDNAP